MRGSYLVLLTLLVSSAAFGSDFGWGIGSGAAGGGMVVDNPSVQWPTASKADYDYDHRRILGGKLELGLGMAVEKTAYKKYDTQWSPGPVIDFENDYMYVRDFGVGAKFINWKDGTGKSMFTASVYAAYDGFEFDPDDTDDPRLKLLNRRKSSVFLGTNIMAMTPIGLFEVNAARDILGHGDGFYGRVAYHVAIDIGRVTVAPRIGVNWADRRYNKYYYGITRHEAQRSGLSVYRPNGSFAPFAGVATVVPITKRWEVAAEVEVGLVPKTVRNSPMTGRKTTCAFGTMVNYKF